MYLSGKLHKDFMKRCPPELDNSLYLMRNSQNLILVETAWKRDKICDHRYQHINLLSIAWQKTRHYLFFKLHQLCIFSGLMLINRIGDFHEIGPVRQSWNVKIAVGSWLCFETPLNLPRFASHIISSIIISGRELFLRPCLGEYWTSGASFFCAPQWLSFLFKPDTCLWTLITCCVATCLYFVRIIFKFLYHNWVWNRGICRRVIVCPRSHMLIARRKIVPTTTIKCFTFSLGKLLHSDIFWYIYKYLETTWHFIQDSWIY